MHVRFTASLSPEELSLESAELLASAAHLEDVSQALAVALETEVFCAQAVAALLQQLTVDPSALKLAKADLAASAELARRCFALVREVQATVHILVLGRPCKNQLRAAGRPALLNPHSSDFADGYLQ